MIRLESSKHSYWRNSYAPWPVLAGEVSFGNAFDWTTAGLSPSQTEAFRAVFPEALNGAGPAGAPEFLAGIAQQLQLIGDAALPFCGVGARNRERRTATVFFSCRDPHLANAGLSLAVQIADCAVQPEAGADVLAATLRKSIDAVKQLRLSDATRRMIGAAGRRGIPWFRMAPGLNFVQLGQGVRQQRLRTAILSPESGIGGELAMNKLLTLTVLSQIGLPAGKFAAIKDAQQALRLAETFGYPVVLKPARGGKGRSVYVDLRSADDLRAALDRVRLDREPFLLQSFFPGKDHRLLVVAGKLIAAAQRIPASVMGDGRRSIAELVAMVNQEPARVRGPLEIVVLDEEADRVLAQQGHGRHSVPRTGERVNVRATANLSTGGTSIDLTGAVHPDNARAAVRAARALGLTVAGVDFICPDISKSWRESGGGICEVNTGVGLRPHELADTRCDVAGAILETVYLAGDDGRIPTAMVTGTVGKTTTTAMLASILTSAGHTVGYATTEGVTIDGERVAQGDFAGRNGASMVLRDPTATAAVLETARGGLLRFGMYLDRCEVAALLNVGREQIGMDGIETLEGMLALKRKVLDAARKAVVLNADDPLCLALLSQFAPSVRTFLFSRGAAPEAVRKHVEGGGDAVFLNSDDGQETIVAAQGPRAIPLVRTAELPSTRGGLIWPNVMNAMAAAALALGLGVAPQAIAEGLKRYGREFPAERGRFNFPEGFPVPILFDFAVFALALASAVSVTDAIPVAGKRICAVALPGNRPDWQYPESAAALAGHFHRFICFEREDLRRGKAAGAIAVRLAEALIAAGADKAAVSIVDSGREAAQLIAREARASDFVAVFGSDRRTQLADFRAAFDGAQRPR